ncbi:hypothetical protein SCYAM73S_03691 [Streptomyces cyaneofuscatus]
MAQLVEAPQQSGAHDQAAALAERRAAAHSTLDDPRSLAQLLEAGAQAGRRPRPSARKRAGSEPPAPPHAAIQRTVPSADAASEPPTTSAPQCRSPRTRRLRSDPPTAAPCPNRGCLFDQPKSAPRHASPCPLFLLGPAMPTPRTSAPRPPPARTRSSTTARRPWCPRRRHRLRLPIARGRTLSNETIPEPGAESGPSDPASATATGDGTGSAAPTDNASAALAAERGHSGPSPRRNRSRSLPRSRSY